MKKKLLMNVWIMLALFTCVGISSCSDNDEDGTKGHQVLRLVDKSGNPIGGISGGDCNLTGSAENLTLRVMSDLDWEITISEGNEWFKADITKGSGSKEISFTVAENEGLEERKATVILSTTQNSSVQDFVLNCIQPGGPRLIVTPENTSVEKEGKDVTIAINTNLPSLKCIIPENVKWITQKSLTNKQLILTVAASDIAKIRTATVEITSESAAYPTTKSIEIRQAGAVDMAELLDVKFNADGTAEDLSAMKMPIKAFAGSTLSMIENETFGYIAKFDPVTINANKITSGVYIVDFTQNLIFQNAIADGFSMELYVTAKDYGESGPIPMGCHGGGGVAITWQDKDNYWTFEPYIGNYSACNTPPLGEVPEETWYHVVGVWDGTGSAGAIKLYLDGEIKAERAPAKGNSFQFPGNKWFVIGGDAGAANEADRAYKGQIAVARIYDRALTAEEVKLLYDTLEE